MAEFVISDTHFGHGNIIHLANRPFDNCAAMDEALIDNWNRVVSPEDTVFHLGDFGWKSKNANLRILTRLHGDLVLVAGNHDTHASLEAYRMLGVACTAYAEIKLPQSGTRCCLFHYPIYEWNGAWRGAVHLHGHTHSYTYSDTPGRYNVSAEAIGFTPKSLLDIEKEHFDLLDTIKEQTSDNADHLHRQ